MKVSRHNTEMQEKTPDDAKSSEKRGKEKDDEQDRETCSEKTKYDVMKEKITMLGTKLIEGEKTIAEKNEVITILKNKLEENRDLIQELNNEVRNKIELNEAITAENEALKSNRTNKSKIQNEEITALKNKLEENKELIQKLNNEIGNNIELNEAITTENEALKADRTNKSKTIERCTTAVRNAKKTIRVQWNEIEEIKKKPKR